MDVEIFGVGVVMCMIFGDSVKIGWLYLIDFSIGDVILIVDKFMDEVMIV